MNRIKKICGMLAVVFVFSCASAQTNISGCWVGNWESSIYGGTGIFSININQSLSSFEGYMKVDGSLLISAGLFHGSINNNTLNFGYVSSSGLQIKYKGSISENTMAGTWEIVGGEDHGMWSANRYVHAKGSTEPDTNTVKILDDKIGIVCSRQDAKDRETTFTFKNGKYLEHGLVASEDIHSSVSKILDGKNIYTVNYTDGQCMGIWKTDMYKSYDALKDEIVGAWYAAYMKQQQPPYPLNTPVCKQTKVSDSVFSLPKECKIEEVKK